MAFTHGKDAILKLDTTGDVLTDISTYLTGVTMSRETDTAEVSALGTTSKAYVVGMKGSTFSLDGRFDPTFDALIEGLFGSGQNTVNFEYYPAGVPVGPTKPKYAGACILTSSEIGSGVDDAASLTCELLVTGPVVRTTA